MLVFVSLLCRVLRVCSEMWGMPFPNPYMQLYKTSAAALKAVHPSLRVGGPATMCLQDAADFVGNASAMKLPVDFVSTHAYPTDGACIGGYNESDPNGFTNAILSVRDDVRRSLAAVEYPPAPFYMTE